MTRAEYEAKYGSKPVISTSTLDTTPAPIRMTRAEYEQTYGVKPFRQTQQQSKGILSDIPSDITETARGFVGAARQGAQNIQEAVTRPGLSLPQRVVGAAVAAPSAVVNMGAEAVIGGAKLFTTNEFEKAVSEKIGQAGQAVAQTGVGKALTNFYNELPEEDKYTLTNIIAPAANVMTAVPVTKGAGVVAEKAIQATPNIGTTLKTVSDKFQSTPDSRIQRVATELGKVEEKYAPTRKANLYDKDIEGSRTRIAQSGVLENAVDETGILNTADAVKAYKAQTIDGVEDVVRKNLENEAKTVNLAELRREMNIALMDSGLEGADLATALKGVEKELKGLAIRADELGEIPLVKVQDAKISTTGNINYQTPPETATYRKTIARVYKNMIEAKSNLDVKAVNSELAKYYRDIERLERLNGRKVEGGKLGKYTAALTGTAIGMGAGSVGGGFGSAVGGIVGGEIGAMLKGKSMAKTMRGGGTGLPENKILQEAKARAEARGGVDLRVPDKKVGAPKDVSKSKEILKTEGLIKKNVQLQEAAIKAGDFTLVAKLKEIYTSLVEKLKEQVRSIRETMKDQGGYARNPFVKDDGQSIPLQRNQRKTTTPANTNAISSTVPKLDAEVKSNIVNILDDYTLNKNPDLELQMDAAKIAEDLGIKLPKTYGALVKKLGEVLDEAEAPKTVKPTGKEGVSGQSVDTSGGFEGGISKTEPSFHGTNWQSAMKIQKEGLNPNQATSLKEGKKNIFLTQDEQYATSYAQQKGGSSQPFVLAFKTPDDVIIEQSTFKKGMKSPDLISQKSIPPEDIAVKGIDGKWYPINEFNFYSGEADSFIGKTGYKTPAEALRSSTVSNQDTKG